MKQYKQYALQYTFLRPTHSLLEYLPHFRTLVKYSKLQYHYTTARINNISQKSKKKKCPVTKDFGIK